MFLEFIVWCPLHLRGQEIHLGGCESNGRCWAAVAAPLALSLAAHGGLLMGLCPLMRIGERSHWRYTHFPPLRTLRPPSSSCSTVSWTSTQGEAAHGRPLVEI